MTLSQETVEHVANLARLALSDEEKERYTQELSNIVDLIQSLDELDLSDIDLEVNPQPTHTRDDIPSNIFESGALLKNAPEPEEGFYRVPRILDNASA